MLFFQHHHQAGRGEHAADTLLDMFPGSGHLQHMPGHLFLRVGRYNDAVDANIEAHGVDEQYMDHGMAPYSAGHNAAFLVYVAAMAGREAVATDYSL